MLQRTQFLKLSAAAAAAAVMPGVAGNGRAISGQYCLGIKTELRKTKIEFELPILDGEGKTMKFSQIAGQAVWINFFASWCPPCNREMPDLLAMEAKYRDAGLTVVGVDVEEPEERARSFRDDHKIPFPILLDRQGLVFKKIFGSNGIPTSLFYSADRTLSCMVIDDLSRKQMDNEIAVALGT